MPCHFLECHASWQYTNTENLLVPTGMLRFSGRCGNRNKHINAIATPVVTNTGIMILLSHAKFLRQPLHYEIWN